jgi:hypothetical protein
MIYPSGYVAELATGRCVPGRQIGSNSPFTAAFAQNVAYVVMADDKTALPDHS